MKLITGILAGLAIVMLIPSGVIAAGCDDYPYIAGKIRVVSTPKGPKFIATGAATVDTDDSDGVLDATMEATMAAKARIAKFFNEDIKSETKIKELTTMSVNFSDMNNKKVTIDSLETTLEILSNNSSSMLRGVVELASCYTKGKLVMVSVGLKPDTIAQAEGGAKLITDSVYRKSTITNSNTGARSGGKAESGDAYTGRTKSYIRGINKLKKF